MNLNTANIRNPANWLLLAWDRMPTSGDVLNRSSLSGWSKTFKVGSESLAVFEAISCLFAGVEQTLELLDRLDVSDRKRQILGRWQYAYSEALVDLHSNHPWSNTISRFNPERKISLEHCATELDDALGDKQSSTYSDIESLASTIEELIAKISADDSLDSHFRNVLADLFECIRKACAEYLMRGNKGVMDSLSQVFSGLLKYNISAQSETERAWLSKLREVLSVAADIATVTGGSLVIANNIAGFISP